MRSAKTLVLLFFLPLAACDPAGARTSATVHAHSTAAAPAEVVDSIIPMAKAMRRFRANLPVTPTALENGLASRDAVVDALVRALARGDVAVFERLALTRAEFAYLYYPDTPMARPPYELPPAIAWFQLRETSRKGVIRAVRRFGGQHWRMEHYRCAEAPIVQGENRVWSNCTVTLGRDGSEPVVARLFGAILERGGRYKVISYENDL